MTHDLNIRTKPAIAAFDFFCGAGGMTRGLLDAGINVMAGFDFDGQCKQTYEENNAPSVFVEKNIRNIVLSDLKMYANSVDLNTMLFAGCAPCQPFSQQNKNGENRNEATLLGEFGRLVNAAKPVAVLIENVPGLARIKGNSTYKRFLRMLEINGYNYKYDVINAKHYGVPQNRRRLILLAIRGIEPSLPNITHGPKLKKYTTVKDTITHYPSIKAGESFAGIDNHIAAKITPINLNRLHHTPHDGGDRRSWPIELRLDCHTGDYEGHTDVYGRMHWDKPSPTLTGRCISISNGRYGHPIQNRAISLREAAALQTFDDNYRFYGSKKQIALQIGNAVPVRLAELLGNHIKTSLH